MSNQLPSLVEFVILFQDQHMICTIDTPKVEEICDLIKCSMEKWAKKKEAEIVMINGITGPCFVSTPYIYGFYLRPAHDKTIDEFQKKLLELADRQTKAAEKCAGEIDKGEDWKGNDNV